MLDDRARDFIDMGVVEDDDDDVFNCKKCGASVMPFDINGCEGCGDPHPGRAPEPERFTCFICGTDDHESLIDAENCCFYPYEDDDDSD